MTRNNEWHAAQVMPNHPSMADRIYWHSEHAKACGCRPIPEVVRVAMRVDQRRLLRRPE